MSWISQTWNILPGDPSEKRRRYLYAKPGSKGTFPEDTMRFLLDEYQDSNLVQEI